MKISRVNNECRSKLCREITGSYLQKKTGCLGEIKSSQ